MSPSAQLLLAQLLGGEQQDSCFSRAGQRLRGGGGEQNACNAFQFQRCLVLRLDLQRPRLFRGPPTAVSHLIPGGLWWLFLGIGLVGQRPRPEKLTPQTRQWYNSKVTLRHYPEFSVPSLSTHCTWTLLILWRENI